MIRRDITTELVEAASEYPVVTIFGPRQSGKTTLVRMTFPDRTYYSLEDPDIRFAAETDPRGFLNRLPEGGILDEIQRVPQLLAYIQGIVDKEERPGHFILTGSHQPSLQEELNQSLAGRTAVLTLLPFSLNELRNYQRKYRPFELIIKGFFPRLHEKKLKPDRFFNGYIQTYVERDVRALINLKDLRRFQQFMVLLAGRVGQVVNYTSLSNDLGVSSTTIKNWISILKASYIIFELPPYFENIRKRVVKSPKIYFTDTGLNTHLLGITTDPQAERDRLRGGFYENLLILDILKTRLNKGKRPEIYFYRDTHGNEVDLIIREGRQVTPIEIKSAATFTGSFLKGLDNFKKTVGERSTDGMVLYNGKEEFEIRGTRIFNPFL